MNPFMYVFGVLSLLSALGVVFAKKSLHSALWLVVTLFTVAVHFALLGADFIAALQILVYAGAIMILVVFVIMLLGLDKSVDDNSFGVPRPVSALICAGFLALVLFVVKKQQLFSDFGEPVSGTKNFLTVDIGKALLSENIVAFETVGLLLLAAIVGAVVLAYDKKRPLTAGSGLRAMRRNAWSEDIAGTEENLVEASAGEK